MNARQNMRNIRKGMTVYTADGQPLGTVERMQRDALMVRGQAIPQAAVARVTGDGVYLDTSYADGMAAGRQEGERRVDVAEERLTVGTREVDLGEVDIRKTVTEEQQTASVTLRRDEVTVEQRDIADRPLRAGETAFEEGTIRIPVRGEEAVVAKEAVITGEVVIDTEQVAEERQVTDTVRREHVDVDENYRQARASADGEPELRHSAETSTTSTTGGENWENLREDIHEGGDKIRKR